MTDDTPKLDPPRIFFVNKAASAGHQDDMGLLPRYLIEKQAGGIVQSQARELEDETAGIQDLRQDQSIVQPLYDPRVLARLAWRNNILPPLIEAMEVNVDGTGHEIVPLEPEDVQEPEQRAEAEGEEEEDETGDELPPEIQKQKTTIESWFDEPWPGESFLTIRRKLRRDQEETGNAYLEVLRNTSDDVIFARHIDAKTMRLVKLDKPVLVEKSVLRGGEEITAQVLIRERRFVQAIAGKFVYFKEFGASRDLDKTNGRWPEDPENQETAGETGAAIRMSPDKRATEIIHLINKRDPETPYGIPRWISNAPSVVGSRRAEEFNLDFFDAGGVPPLMIIVQGGKLAEDAEKALREHFLASGVARHQAAVLEAFSTSGDINSPQNVRVTVERFGADRQKDSMFEKYTENCDKRTRRSFRLPSLFLGMSDDVSFATAFASYTVAEAQVFKPERDEFDEMVNLKLMPALPDGDKFAYRSLPVIAVGAERQLSAMELVKDIVEPAELVEEINQLANLSLKVKAKKDESPLDPRPPIEQPGSQDDIDPATGKPPVKPDQGEGAGDQPGDSVPPGARPAAIQASERNRLRVLAYEFAAQMERGFRDDHEVARFQERLLEMQTLYPAQEETFYRHLAHALFDAKGNDPEGSVALAKGLLEQFASTYGE